MLLMLTIVVMVVCLWALTSRRIELAFGLGLGLGLAWLGGLLLPGFTLKTMPVWLPALPFALVALTLLCFGVLAWWWGTDR